MAPLAQTTLAYLLHARDYNDESFMFHFKDLIPWILWAAVILMQTMICVSTVGHTGLYHMRVRDELEEETIMQEAHLKGASARFQLALRHRPG